MSSNHIYTLQSNKYSTLYFKIVESAKQKSYDCYTEYHHIIPRSLGGTDDDFNLIKVSAREHFILHYLLTKCTKGEQWYKMVNAFNMMNCVSTSQNNQRYINSRLYESNRKHMSKTMQYHQSGSKNSQFGTKWFTSLITGESKKFKIELINELLEQCWVIGRNSNKFIEKMKFERNNIEYNKQYPEGGLIRLFHSNGEFTFCRERSLYDFILDGWMIYTKISTTSIGHLRIKQIYTNENLTVIPTIAEILVKSGKWEYGYHNPNRRGKANYSINKKKQ